MSLVAASHKNISPGLRAETARNELVSFRAPCRAGATGAEQSGIHKRTACHILPLLDGGPFSMSERGVVRGGRERGGRERDLQQLPSPRTTRLPPYREGGKRQGLRGREGGAGRGRLGEASLSERARTRGKGGDWQIYMIEFCFPNSRALLPIFRINCPDGSYFAQMGSHLAQNTTINPYSLLSRHNPLLRICRYLKRPQPHPKTPLFLI